MFKTKNILKGTLVVFFLPVCAYACPQNLLKTKGSSQVEYEYSEEKIVWNQNVVYRVKKDPVVIAKNSPSRVIAVCQQVPARPSGYSQKPLIVKKHNSVKKSNARKKTLIKKQSIPQQKIAKKYKVQRGDTLYSISRKFKVPVNQLMKYNGLNNNSKLYAGVILNLVPNVKQKSISKKTKKVAKRNISQKKVNVSSSYKKNEFKWPVQKVNGVKRDGKNGVKSIGIIITSKPGAVIKPSAAGKVCKVGYMRGYGDYVIIKHKQGYYSVYSGLNSIYVREGKVVAQNTNLGKLSYNERNLHFQINKAGKTTDPLRLLPKRS